MTRSRSLTTRLLAALTAAPLFAAPLATLGTVASTAPAAAQETELLDIEKDELEFGFIKLTDCAPIVIAKEKGFFDDEGLSVTVTAQPNWKTLLDGVISGDLDGAHMLSGQPIAATIGVGTKASIITAFTMDLNGNGITVANSIWEQMQKNDPALDVPQPAHPITAASLGPIVEQYKSEGKKLQMGMVFPVSTHNYEIRYWLASAGIHPGMYTSSDVGGRTDADVELSVTPPPLMPQTLEAGNIQGYCVGEPWNQAAVAKAEENPQTMLAVTKALIKAGKWLDETDAEGNLINREEACRLLSRSDYVGAPYEVIKSSMTGTFVFQKSDVRKMPDFNVFFKHDCTYPWYSDGVWFLTQMRRWGQIGEEKPAEWYAQVAKDVYKPDIYMAAAALLVEEGFLTEQEVPSTEDGYRPATSDFIDGKTYDGRDPLGYLAQFEIGNKK